MKRVYKNWTIQPGHCYAWLGAMKFTNLSTEFVDKLIECVIYPLTVKTDKRHMMA